MFYGKELLIVPFKLLASVYFLAEYAYQYDFLYNMQFWKSSDRTAILGFPPTIGIFNIIKRYLI